MQAHLVLVGNLLPVASFQPLKLVLVLSWNFLWVLQVRITLAWRLTLDNWLILLGRWLGSFLGFVLDFGRHLLVLFDKFWLLVLIIACLAFEGLLLLLLDAYQNIEGAPHIVQKNNSIQLNQSFNFLVLLFFQRLYFLRSRMKIRQVFDLRFQGNVQVHNAVLQKFIVRGRCLGLGFTHSFLL